MGTSAKEVTGASGPESVFLEDIEKQQALDAAEAKKKEQAAEAAEKIKAEAEARKAAGVQDDASSRFSEALRISEEARQRAEERARIAEGRTAAPATETKTDDQPALNDEQLNELWGKDPLKAVRYMLENSVKVLDANVEKRIAPLVAGTSVAARQAAEAKYPDEFKLFKDEIDQLLKDPRVGNLNHPQAWDDMMSYIRGKNIDKLLDFKLQKKAEADRVAAQGTQAEAAGTHTRSTVRAPAPVSDGELDATERQIAEAIHRDMSPEEAHKAYKNWKGTGR